SPYLGEKRGRGRERFERETAPTALFRPEDGSRGAHRALNTVIEEPSRGSVHAMKCPFCGVSNKDRVLETRTLNEGVSIKRRRECEACGRRFTTMEEIEELQLFVIKSDNTREPFDRKKVMKGMELACKGRKISIETLHEASQEIERQLYNRLEKE